MSRVGAITSSIACFLLLMTFITPILGLTPGELGGAVRADLSLGKGYRAKTVRRARDRRLQDDEDTAMSDILTLKGLPNRFTIRPMVDSSLCVTRVTLTTTAVARARARSGLPPTSAYDVAEYGSARLVLLACSGSRAETFLAEAIMGRFYRNSDVSYRQGFLKHPADLNTCMYGVNSTYTDGHPVFGVTDTQFYTATPYKAKGAAIKSVEGEDEEMDWFDDYTFDYAPYIRYGYDPVKMFSNSTFRSPNPLPLTMLDASGWGPFHTSWGPCMENPTKDTATPVDTAPLEIQLRYQSWIFVDVPDTPAISHLPARLRNIGFTLATLGPDRPQPDMSPKAGTEDAGQLSADLGGGDKPYGTGYSSLVSNELCMTTSVIKEGAEVRLARCNPVSPALTQVFQLVGAARVKSASMG